MKENRVYYEATDFIYPTKEERKSVNDSFPDLYNFGFDYQPEIEAMIGLNDLKSFNKKSHLYWWDLCLLNKMRKFYNAYLNCHSNFHRGIPTHDDVAFKKNI